MILEAIHAFHMLLFSTIKACLLLKSAMTAHVRLEKLMRSITACSHCLAHEALPVLQPQGTVDNFISNLINTDIDLAGSVNGTATGSSTYYSPVIHTTTIGPLEPGVTYYYRVCGPAPSLPK